MIIELSPIQWLILLVAAGSTVLGLLIGYQAYRGFRRNAERSMQFLSIGLILLTAVAYSLAFVGSLLLRLDYLPSEVQTPLTLLVRLIQFAGLACITYSLYTRS